MWARVSSTALAVSMIGPTWFADGTTSLALISLHVATAVVVIIGGCCRGRFAGVGPGACQP